MKKVRWNCTKKVMSITSEPGALLALRRAVKSSLLKHFLEKSLASPPWWQNRSKKRSRRGHDWSRNLFHSITTKETDFEIKVQRDLSDAPNTTTAVWSFGEWGSDHRKAAKRSGPATILIDTVYTVGPLYKFTTNTSLEDGRMREYGFYWSADTV
jgi:Flp pilus assembly protein TadG